MKMSSLKMSASMVIAGGFASTANATVLNVDYVPTAAGTDITIGANSTPQYTFSSIDFFNGSKTRLQANGTATVAFPYNGVVQTPGPYVLTSFGGGAVQNVGDFQLAFNIGSAAYTGLATVTNGGQEITRISYDAAPSVPEPATWAMMVLGLGIAGSALRRQRRNQTTGAAMA